MLGNIICWAIAAGIMLSKTTSAEDPYTRTLLAMGFIFLGILSKAVDVYRETHETRLDQETINKIRNHT